MSPGVKLPIDDMLPDVETFQKEKDPRPMYWARLGKLDAGEVCAATGAVRLKDGRLVLRFLNEELWCDPKVRGFTDAAGAPMGDLLLEMVVLFYLCGRQQTVGETPPPGRALSPLQLPTGETFFRGPHVIPTAPLAEAFGHDAKGFLRAGAALGGRAWNRGEASFVLTVLPFVEMHFILYGADDEFPAKATLLVSETIDHYLTLDAVWGLCNVVVKRILEFKDT